MQTHPDFLSLFPVKKPVLGMLHLESLPGEPGFVSLETVVSSAKRDIKALQEGGIHGIVIENWREDSSGQFVSVETAQAFDTVLSQIVGDISVPFGINVLNNDYKTMYTLAADYHASFVQLDVFVDDVISDFTYGAVGAAEPFTISPNPQEITSYGKRVHAETIPLIVFIQPKHYIMVDKDKSIAQSATQAFAHGASAVIVTKKTGVAPTLDVVERAKEGSGGRPVGIGSGADASTIADFFRIADFAIIGTALKKDGITNNPVDPKRVRAIVSAIPL